MYIIPHIHNTYIHTNIYTYIQTYMHNYLHAHIQTYIHTYIHTYTCHMGEAYIKGAYSTDKTHVALGSHEQTAHMTKHLSHGLIRKYGHCQPLVWYNVTPSGYAFGYYIIPHSGLTMTILPYKPYDNYYIHTYIHIIL